MQKARVLASIASVFITTPIWFYLLYKVLVSVEATELMWFLFWIYIPFGLAVSITLKVTAETKI